MPELVVPVSDRLRRQRDIIWKNLVRRDVRRRSRGCGYRSMTSRGFLGASDNLRQGPDQQFAVAQVNTNTRKAKLEREMVEMMSFPPSMILSTCQRTSRAPL